MTFLHLIHIKLTFPNINFKQMRSLFMVKLVFRAVYLHSIKLNWFLIRLKVLFVCLKLRLHIVALNFGVLPVWYNPGFTHKLHEYAPPKCWVWHTSQCLLHHGTVPFGTCRHVRRELKKLAGPSMTTAQESLLMSTYVWGKRRNAKILEKEFSSTFTVCLAMLLTPFALQSSSVWERSSEMCQCVLLWYNC